MGIIANIAIAAITSAITLFGLYNYAPLQYIQLNTGKPNFGTTITTINGSDTLSNSRTTINTNFSNLNTGKFELSDWYATTSAQQLTTLANLSTIGTITSGTWNGSPIPISFGGTGQSYLGGNGTVIYTSAANTIATSSNFTFASNKLTVTYASTTAITSSGSAYFGANNANVGIASTSPYGLFSINVNGTTYPAFVIGSTTGNYFSINQNGSIQLSEAQPATSTAMVLDWAATGSTIDYRIGGAATTITLINATTSSYAGSRKVVWICNPDGTAGALTWAGVEWIGTAPSQTTTAGQCDVYSFIITHATSTTAYKVAGSAGVGFQ